MTTIVYRAGVLAGDGRETSIEDGESTFVVRDDCVKVYRLPDGRLFAGARTSEEIERMRRLLMEGKEKWPTPKLDDVNLMIIDLKGRIWTYEGAIWQRVHAEYEAIGSGSRFALPALDAGAGAVKACKIGSRRDPYSGGKITVLKLRRG